MPERWSSHWNTPDLERRAAFLRLDEKRVEEHLRTAVVASLPSLENRVFELANATIVKLYRPDRWGVDALDEEHRFLEALGAAGVHVARALDRGTLDGVEYAIFPKLEGERLPDDPDDELLAELGRLVARVHEVGASEDARGRLTLEPEPFGIGNLRFLLEHDVLPVAVRDAYVERVESIVRRAEPMFRSVPMHRVHGDFHGENCLRTSRGLVLIDFDDMMMGPAVQDVWLPARTKPSRPDEAESARRRRIVVQAYREVRAFEDAWLDLVPTLRALRSVWMNAWIASRWFDPLFPKEFPRFGTRAYWDEQLARLA